MNVEHRPESAQTPIEKTPAMRTIEELHEGLIEDILCDLYWRQGKSIKEVASKLGKGHLTIRGWMRLFGIPVRSTSESLVVYYQTHPEGRYRGRRSTRKDFFQTRYKNVIDVLGGGSVEDLRKRLTEIYRQDGSLDKTSRTIKRMGITINYRVVKGFLKELGIEDNESYTKSLIQEAVENGDFSQLTDKQRQALTARFLTGERVRTLRECQEELGITHEAVRLRNNGGLRKLKDLKRDRMANKKDVQKNGIGVEGIIFKK